MCNFFSIFFVFLINLSRGFLGNRLSSLELIMFVFITFVIGNNEFCGLLFVYLVLVGGFGSWLVKVYVYFLFLKDESGLDVL